MVTRRTAKKTTAKKAVAAPAPETIEEEETIRRGRQPDLGKYELFSEWAAEELDVEIDPEQAMFVLTHYKRFQTSDMNREYNENKSAAVQEAREAREAAREEREASREEKTTTKATAKKSAAAASAPATAKRTAKKTTARRASKPEAAEAF